ncbi:MAG: UDP-N-acetylmuramate--L-alanine ligase [Planctomycetota bacterium]|nr:UDP-N-acetylmuramate--L-alanine ligase [Planctomycetota bacterium]
MELPALARDVAAPDLTAIRRAYLVGVGGVGMSGAAELVRARGIDVRGSDRQPPAWAEQDDAPLPEDVDALFYSAAIPPSHPQRAAAQERGVPQYAYADLIGALMADRVGVCVAGSHGKTTTSSILASALVHAGRDPSFVVGGQLLDEGRGWRSGEGPAFVVESCEFARSFHRHRPQVAIVTNVDEDHLDYYADLAEIQESFRVFAALVPHDGVLIVNDAYVPVFRGDSRLRCGLQSYGFSDEAHWQAGEPEPEDGGRTTRFALRERGTLLGDLRIPMTGRHNVLNATAAAAAMMASGCSFEETAAALAAFRGVARRQEWVAECGGVTVLDDYGHHPAEIRATVGALRTRFPDRRLVVIFQPHQASRTRCLMKEFAVALARADEVWLPPIYFARDSEEERRAVTSEDLARHVSNEGGTAQPLQDLAAAVEHGVRHLLPGDVVVTMGAGNVDEVARGLAARLR